jgi:Zn-dependent M28 family amino/carboxypeptidase
MDWLETGGTPHGAHPELHVLANLSDTGIEALLAAAGRELADTQPATQAGGRGFDLGVSVHLAYRSERRNLESHNVAAVLPGADPAVAGEAVVFSAHLDHLGRGADVEGEDVYNGFYDNAMGSALLLETARAFATAAQRPRRSLVFLAVTGEERGLLGSEHFAAHPPPAVGRLVADVNLDMPLFLYPVGDVVAFGAEHSSLEGPATRAARAAGFALSPDPIPDEVIFVRSDQYSFVERGVPSVYLMPGFTSRDPKVNGEAAFRGFLATHYHQPSDEPTLPVDWPSAVRFLQANVTLAREIADDEQAPQWKADDFFGKTFGHPEPAAVAPSARHLQR